MSWSDTFLGVIAAATLVIALIQVGAIVAILRLAKQVEQTVTRVQQTMVEVQGDVRPLIAKVTAVADEASQTAAIATAQAQKIDRLLTDLGTRVEQTAAVVQEAIVTPAREGLAIVAALKAGFTALRGVREHPRHGRPAEEEDPLFIG